MAIEAAAAQLERNKDRLACFDPPDADAVALARDARAAHQRRLGRGGQLQRDLGHFSDRDARGRCIEADLRHALDALAACPEIADRQIKVAKADLPASEIMPADISPIDIAYALYDKSLEWAKDRRADVLVCAPIPAHAKMIERYSQGRKLPMQNLGKFDDVTQEGVVKEKLLYGMQLTDNAHFNVPARMIQ